ncbi:MAG: GspE/PulE family protein [Candidatus Pacebacteria bacterium]|nr:GspE/PulE family protein [Candidatus Paceibacterota bacterium]MDD5555441.1 GspE/PulE family protein [Candidatus Paceibacterota bacterium]
MEKITGKLELELGFLFQAERKFKNLASLVRSIEEASIQETSLLLKTIMGGAVYLDASDLHLEAEEGGGSLRMRIDGLLHKVYFFNSLEYRSLVSRIKLLSKMKLNIERKPQDGRFTVVLKKNEKPEEIEIRVSTLPSEHGETVVMRVLNPKNLINLEDLGLRKDLYQVFTEQSQKPNGMIIVTGPTGSGKTTTLYAFLKKIKSPEIKIITIEDPIEYHLEGISQTQVDQKRGYDFPSGLKSIVRQDPDVILVGEVRDLETASIALQAALTGHLVFSTLHTNDAAGTVARLQALGEKPVNIAPALSMVVAQRLVRKICPACAEAKTIPAQTYKEMQAVLKNLPESVEHPNLDPKIKILFPKGCEACNNTGYKGRLGIFEAFVVDNETEDFILTSPSSSAIEKFAVNKGMATMKQDGYIKILNNVTTMEEIKKATG